MVNASHFSDLSSRNVGDGERASISILPSEASTVKTLCDGSHGRGRMDSIFTSGTACFMTDLMNSVVEGWHMGVAMDTEESICATRAAVW